MRIHRVSWHVLVGVVLSSAVAVFAVGCDDLEDDPAGAGPKTNGPDGSADGSSSGGPRRPSPLPSRGSSIALSADDTRLVTANREAGTASIFSVDWKDKVPAIEKLAEIAIGGEVSQVAMDPNGDFALAVSRIDQKL